jgi:hypothetical protein
MRAQYSNRPDCVVLAGQGTRLSNVRSIIENEFGSSPIVDQYQDSAVARGLGNYLRTLGDKRTEADKNLLLLINVYGREIQIDYVKTVLRDESRVEKWQLGGLPEDRIGALVQVGVAGLLIGESSNTQRLSIVDRDSSIQTQKLVTVYFDLLGKDVMTIFLSERIGLNK